VTIYCNYQSPVCAWYLIIFGVKKLAIYDLFRDIYISVPHDGLHLAKNVLSNSLNLTLQHWVGSITNGVKMLSGNLLYGHDQVLRKVYQSLTKQGRSDGINVYDGKRNISLLNQIISESEEI